MTGRERFEHATAAVLWVGVPLWFGWILVADYGVFL